MSQIIRVIDIQDDALWWFAVRLDKHIDKHFCNPIKAGARDTVFKTADSRLTG
jgi:hypothetical protein